MGVPARGVWERKSVAGAFLCAAAAAVVVVGDSGCGARDARPRAAPAGHPPVRADQVERVTTGVPFPRGLALVDGTLYVLARGRVREAGGVDPGVDDQAGAIFAVDPAVAHPITDGADVPEAVRTNARLFAAPTSPPFKLLDRSVTPPERDRETDRPYCALRFDPATSSFYVCAFSGIDKPDTAETARVGASGNFSKNTGDAVLRYDTRTGTWHEVERHNLSAGGNYPHHDPALMPPPHGWTNGPDNCLVVGRWLYVVAKDNNLLVRYDLSGVARDPAAGAPPSYRVLGDRVRMRDGAEARHRGHSMLAARDGWLYVGFRTSSTIVRIRLDADGVPVQPVVADLVATFDPYDPVTRKSANLTDMAFGPDGDLYVVSAQPSRVHRFRPDPRRPYDGRTGATPAWADLAALTGNPRMKSENVLVDDAGRVYVTSGDAYAYSGSVGGAVYRISPASR